MDTLGRHIVDPRILSEQVGDSTPEPPTTPTPATTTTTTDAITLPGLPINPRPSPSRPTVDSIYNNLSSFKFGVSARPSDGDEGLSPLTPLPSDTTPRPSIVSPLHSHPSQSSGPAPPSSQEGAPRPRPPAVLPDDASYHTFGPGHYHEPSSSSASVASSRPSSRISSRIGYDSELISDDEVEIGTFSGDPPPVVFANPLPGIDEDPHFSTPSWCYTGSLQGRKGSLPMAIPGVSPDGSPRSREGSILTLRRPSRSLDNEYGSHLTGIQDPTAVTPKSEPHSRADWLSIEAQIQAANAQSQASAEAQQPSPLPENVYNNLGLDLQYIFQFKHPEGSIRSFRSSAQYSSIHLPNAQPSEPSFSRFAAIAPFAVDPRRTSTTTVQTANSEDDFLRHIRKNDGMWGAMEDQWLYRCLRVEFVQKRKKGQHIKTPSNLPPPSQPAPITDPKVHSKTMHIGQLEYWSCPNIGDFKVDRNVLKHDTKADQHRLNVRYIQDPNSKTASVRPSTLIHKHSRAVAFSIFRSFHLNGGRGGHTHITTSTGVMLAPRKVQEQYTSTKTTQQLSTHGLLDDDPQGSRGGRGGTRDQNKRPPDEVAKAAKGKGKKKDKGTSSGESNPKQKSPTSSQDSATSKSTVETATVTPSTAVASSSRVQLFPRAKPTPSQPVPSMAPTDSAQVSESGGDPTQPAKFNGGSGDSDEERVPARTPHAEALGALDARDIEHYRSKVNRSNADPGTSLTGRWLRMLRGPKADSASSSFSVYRPPWITTASPEMQAEKDRVISDLNKSFKDVGLLHQPPKANSKAPSNYQASSDVLADIPDDCLYMLLPLWVGEIDRQGPEADWTETSTTTSALTLTVPENRYYLLVWYVSWEDRKGKPEQKAETKKKKVSSQDSGTDAEPQPLALTTFHVNARVVHYDDLRHSGVRAPSTGLAINPAWEAMHDLDFPAAHQDHRTMSSVVCQCHGRHRGFLFDPHGFAQLGLCDVETSGPVSDRDGVEEPTQTFSFTTIGKAAAEMIWLGCLAVTSFGV